MTIRIRSIGYEDDGVALEGELAWDDRTDEPRPAVLVVHDALKSTEGFERGRARALAELGYAGFAIDVYGKGVHAADTQQAGALFGPFVQDRAMLRRRLLASVRATVAQPEVDPQRLAAIGYCFGGMCVLELARAGAPLRGVASFHGLLGASDVDAGDPGAPIAARVLVLHGWDDPFVPPEQVLAFTEEMTRRRADWQLLAFGRTLHAFSKPGIDDTVIGAVYDAAADRRSWQALRGFLAELFADVD